MIRKLIVGIACLSLIEGCSTTSEPVSNLDANSPDAQSTVDADASTTTEASTKAPIPPPPPMDFEPTRLPQVSLTVNTVDSFIRWATAAPRVQADEVLAQIDQARCEPVPQPLCNPAVIDALFQRLDKQDLELPTRLIILATLGALRDSRVEQRLFNFINRPLPTGSAFIGHDQLTAAGAQEMLQSRAVEALAHNRSAKALQLTFNIAKQHPSRAIRARAIDTYLYHNNDSEAARSELQKVLPQEDWPLLFRVRKTLTTNVADYNRKLAEFNQRFPPQFPPLTKSENQPPNSNKPETPPGRPPVVKCPTGVSCR